jgi:hypothetical protein
MRFLSLVLLLSCSVLALAAPPASASCIGPSISVSDGEVRRGETLRVGGEGWGDECYDTGVPRDAHGPLGNPLDDIEIAFVQDGKETVVARGSADDDYRLDALVTVPRTLRPGIARLVARSGDTGDYERPTVIISNAKPVAAEGPDVRAFGYKTVPLSDIERPQTEESAIRGWVVGGVAAIVLAAATVLIVRRARQRSS